jgi:hypothetical protein
VLASGGKALQNHLLLQRRLPPLELMVLIIKRLDPFILAAN